MYSVARDCDSGQVDPKVHIDLASQCFSLLITWKPSHFFFSITQIETVISLLLRMFVFLDWGPN